MTQMTRDQLLAAVPIHLVDGTLPYIRLADIPSGPWIKEFAQALDAMPHRDAIEDETGTCAYYRDLLFFLDGHLDVKPSGLAPDDDRPDLTRAQLQAIVPVHEADKETHAHWVRVIDIPRPHREAFLNSMTGSTVPFRRGECALGIVYGHDWLSWCAGFTPGWEGEHGARRPK